MKDTKTVSTQEGNFVCFRCGSIINPGERMVTMSVSLETPDGENSIKTLEGCAVSCLCTSCASVLISKAITADDNLMMPPAMSEDREEEEDETEDTDSDSECEMDIPVNGVIESIDEKGDGTLVAHTAELGVQCSENGFSFRLGCSDGPAAARSQLFTWEQIAQLLVTTDPNMFGVLNEPLPQVFRQNLERLGFDVPNWKA